MKRQITTLVQYALTIALAIGIMLTPNARILSHIPVDPAQIAAQHQSDIEDHGHAHDEIVDAVDAYHGHSHGVVDHDHAMAVLPQRRDSNYLARGRTHRTMMKLSMSDRKTFDLDRPPRG